jgi:hypothetical protein
MTPEDRERLIEGLHEVLDNERLTGLGHDKVLACIKTLECAHRAKQTPDPDAFERDDCGAFVYPNGFKMPMEETGLIWEACETWHGGQGSNLYALMSSGNAAPSIICGAARELERAANSATSIDHIVAETLQAVEDLNKWADGVRELIETD